jgi:diguanylate cyclase (GGDEF)-like protein
MVARIGGDEFIVLLPKTDEEAAHIALERIYHFLELNNKNNHSEIKISIGIATCDKKGSLANTVKQADKQMYQDKRKRVNSERKSRK